MTLLESFDESVIPSDFYQRCIDAHSDATLSRQVPHSMYTLHGTFVTV